MNFDVEYDVVVIGSGGSGKSAAYTIATESDLSVVVLEKAEETGGTSKFAEGDFAVESSEQKSRKQPDYPGELPAGAHFPTKAEAIRRILEFSHYRANTDLVQAYVEGTAETIEIMKNIGVEFTDVTIYAFDQPNELYGFHRPDGLGARIQECLLPACENAGVDFFTSTPAKKLLKEDGRIVGVVAVDSDGNEMNIGAKAVVIATGGYADNLDLVRKYSWAPHLADNNFMAIEHHNVGDGLLMAEEVGASIGNTGVYIIATSVYGHTQDGHINGLAIQPTLYVNSKGKRFVNEDVTLNFANFGHVASLLPDGVVWTILDAKIVDYYANIHGSDVGAGDYTLYGQKFEHFDSEVENAVSQNDPAVLKEDTLEALAQKMGVDYDTFAATVARYNEICAAGEDVDYYKPARFLAPIEEGPFYAIKQVPSIDAATGCIRVNANLQVIDDMDEPLPGLYAVGNDAAGLYGDGYCLDTPGIANSFAHTSGRLAARHIIKTVCE